MCNFIEKGDNIMKKYEKMSIEDIIEFSKKDPKGYLSCLRRGLFTDQLNRYFIKRYKLRDGFNVGDVYSLLSTDPNYSAEIVYAPWARNYFIEMLNNYWKGPQVLDIQLGGACNCNCAYCDSPECNRINSVDLKIIQKLIEKNSIKQIYICGLGEPTAKQNILKLKIILQMAEAYGIKVSMFTNLLNMDDELFDYLSKGTLNILYKHDTDDISTMSYLYGCSTENAQRMLDNEKTIKECVLYDPENRTTNIGASIVPTQKNIKEIPDIIEACVEKRFYPLIGDLEHAGRAITNWKDLAVDSNSLSHINDTMRKHGIHGIDICPAGPLSIHITNLNFAVADHTTGSSCPWIKLESPEYEAFAFLPESTKKLWYKVNKLRNEKLPNNIKPWLEELSMLGVAPNIIDSIKKDPTEIIKYLGILSTAQIYKKRDKKEGCGGDFEEVQKVLSLASLSERKRFWPIMRK